MPEHSKTVIVTGGASGIGYAFAEHLARVSHRIVIVDLRGAEEAAARLRSSGHKALGIRVDVVSEDDVANMARAAQSDPRSQTIRADHGPRMDACHGSQHAGPFQLRQGRLAISTPKWSRPDRQHRLDCSYQRSTKHGALRRK